MSQSVSNISFDEIPSDWRVPGTYLEVRPDRRNMGAYPYPARTLIIAPKLAAGSGATLRALAVTRKEDAVALAGAGSIAAEMVEFYIQNNRTGALSLMLMDDPASGAVAASGTITFTGAPTASGTFVTRIGGRRIAIPVNTTDTPTTVAARLVAAITALTTACVTAANVAGAVTLTAKHKGLVGNFIPVVIAPEPEIPVPAGLTATLVALTNGTGESDIAPVISAIATENWTDLVFPMLSTSYMTQLPAELDRRFNAMVRLDTYVWGMAPGTFSALTTAGAAQNSRFVTQMGAKNSPSPPWQWAAALAGRAAFYLLNDPARQLRSLPLAGIVPPAPVDRFIDTERDLLLRAGISTFTVTSDGLVILERVITQYQKTSLSVVDTAYLDVTIPKTVMRIRYDWISYMNATWPRPKLADDGAPAAEFDPEVATPRRLHNSWAGRLKVYERLGWVQDASASANESRFTRSLDDRNRVDARQRAKILGNLMTLAGVLDFSQ